MPTPVIDRRRLLQLAAAAAGSAWLPRSAWSQPRLRESPFGAGVASGSPDASSVVLWTRLVAPELPPQPVTVRWEIADDEGFARVVAAGQAQALPELAHSVHVEAQGLAPDRWYFYRFLLGSWVSDVGRTRTLPAPDAQVARFRLAYASCQRWDHGYFSAYRAMREDQPDAVLFVGDAIYEYARSVNQVRATDGQTCVTLPQYRDRYLLYRGDPDLRAMHAACPWFLTWDDHEVQNDYAGDAPGDGLPGVADFLARRAAAYQAYYEHMPLRASTLTQALGGLLAGREVRLYGERRIGRLVQLALLDCRQYRSVQACRPAGRASTTLDPQDCPALQDPARSFLGAAQERWLDERLAAGGAAWTVIGQSTLFGQRDLSPGPGQRFWTDGWDGYPAARRRLLDSLAKHRPANPVLLGGDVHENWVGQVKADYDRPDSANLGVEFCGTSISSRSSHPERVPDFLAENPHFIHADGTQRGYGLAEFTPERLQVALRVMDDVTRPDGKVSTQASFVVEAGRAVVERA
ncbi:MAG: alkaline phosphatase D family protein [Burkholderiales bacterium]|nr:alkaline phosphatase D family protein [Burkholderiales bacterium]